MILTSRAPGVIDILFFAKKKCFGKKKLIYEIEIQCFLHQWIFEDMLCRRVGVKITMEEGYVSNRVGGGGTFMVVMWGGGLSMLHICHFSCQHILL